MSNQWKTTAHTTHTLDANGATLEITLPSAPNSGATIRLHNQDVYAQITLDAKQVEVLRGYVLYGLEAPLDVPLPPVPNGAVHDHEF